MVVPVQNIIADSIQRVREIVRGCSTRSVVAFCLYLHLNFERAAIGFSSPAKQMPCLISIMLEAPEPPNPIRFDASKARACVEPLERLFLAQGRHNLSVALQDDPSGKEMKERRMATMAHIHRFNQRIMATVEQTITRANLYLVPYDNQLSQDMGITASKALVITQWVRDKLQESLLQAPRERGINPFEFCVVNREELVAEYGKDGITYWDLFTVKRGDGSLVSDHTADNVAEERPLIQVSNETATMYDINALYNAVIARFEGSLLGGNQRESYLMSRGKIFENHVAETFPKILGKDTDSYRNLSETPGRSRDFEHDEHDLVLIHENTCFIIESKAVPLQDPFRDYSPAFRRLKQAFGKSIQYAYKQADHLLKQLRAGKEVALYDRKGVEQVRLLPSMHALAVCVTRDDYGFLATDLSVLLEKEPDQAYPWVVNIFNLEDIAEIWTYFNWDIRQLMSYLSYRVQLHGRVFAGDEMEYVGAYVHHCGLTEFVNNEMDVVAIPPYYTDIFDDIHSHIIHHTPLAGVRLITPKISEFEISISHTRNILTTADQSRRIIVERSEECPCESGVEFEKCHGRVGQ